MAWIEYNPNPAGIRASDCTVRAITIATDEDWNTAYCGITMEGLMMKDMPSSNKVWGSYLRKKGFRRKMIPDTCPDCYTLKQFCEDHPEGMFIVGVQNHVVAVVDGDYFDAWDSGDESPLFYYYLERTEEK